MTDTLTDGIHLKPTIVNGEWVERPYRLWRDENGVHDEPTFSYVKDAKVASEQE